MDTSTFLELNEPDGTDPFARSTFNTNMELLDKMAIAMSLLGTGYAAGTITKGAMSFDGNGDPQSQTISGPNSLAGTITWSFTATAITETLSITAPDAWSVVKTVTLATLAETWTFS